MSILIVLVLLVVCVVAVAPFVEPVDQAITRIALHLFREPADKWAPRREERIPLLQSVHSTATYTVYTARTILFSLVAGVLSFVLTGLVAHAGFSFVVAHREQIKARLPEQMHIIVDPNPDLGMLSNLGGSGSLPVGLPSKVGIPVPGVVLDVARTAVSVLPRSVRTALFNGGDSEGATPGTIPNEIEILIVFPEIELVPNALTKLSPIQLLLLAIVALTVGTATAVTVYLLRWYDLKDKADNREVLIDESLARTIAFIYALSRSDMLYPEIFRTVGENRHAFGESAEEIGVIVKEMDLFGTDIITSVKQTARWTPSEQFSDFLENFANVLQSGQNVTDYLSDQYEQYQEERVANQEQLLELFTALGEGYVAVLVAGPLFLITIISIFGILSGGMLKIVQLIVYLWIPVSNAGFIYYVGSIGQPLSTYQAPINTSVERRGIAVRESSDPGAEAVPDGGTATKAAAESLRRLELYNQIRQIRWALKRPVETITQRPVVLLYVTVPLALASIVVRWWAGGIPGVRTVDDWLIQATLFVAGTFAVVQEIHTRRLRAIERAIPDFLDSLASTNEAGMTFTESLRRIDQGDFGVLDDEFERLIADIELGGRTEQTLNRFSQRIGSPTITRIVALITNALRASGHIGPVIRIAADEARQDRLLKKQRRQEMFMYVIIVYISFLVFLGIAVALNTVLVPAIPSADQLGNLGSAGGSFGVNIAVEGGGEVNKGSYMLALFHGAVIQAVLSGLVAGKMSAGDIKSGAKHVTIMLALAYGIFLLFG
ncbi:MAG: type II secretion system F family protein [Halobacteriales archaeon]|nr:type II secretion system F family protein [Halobacteriales archaeon]